MSANKLNFSTMTLADLATVSENSKQYRRAIEKKRRQVNAQLKRIITDMDSVYKDKFAYDVVVRLENQDLPWHGDFDVVRPILANLMDKLIAYEVLTDEVHELAISLAWMNSSGEK